MNGKEKVTFEELVGHFIEFKDSVKDRLDRIEEKAERAATLAESTASIVKTDMDSLKKSVNLAELELKNQGKTFAILAQIPKVARIILAIFVAFGGFAVIGWLIQNWHGFWGWLMNQFKFAP